MSHMPIERKAATFLDLDHAETVTMEGRQFGLFSDAQDKNETTKPVLSREEIISIGRKGLESEVVQQNPEIEIVDEMELVGNQDRLAVLEVISDETISLLARIAIDPNYNQPKYN